MCTCIHGRMLKFIGVLVVYMLALPMIMLMEPENVNASPNTYYVAVTGDDLTGDGSLLSPWRTIQKAASMMQSGDIALIREGTYRETVTPPRSGVESAPITFKSYPNENVTISGADPLSGWSLDSSGALPLLQAPMEWSLGSGNQIFINGGMAEIARWPNNTGTLLEPSRATAEAGSNTTLTDGSLPANIDWTGADIWFAGGASWVGDDSVVTQYDPASHKLTFTSVRSANSNYDPRSGTPYVLSGIKAALDAENEWWLDEQNRRLFIKPPAGYDASNVKVEAKKRIYGFDLSDRSYIRLEGLRLFATSIKTNDQSNHLVIDRLHAQYVSHNSRNNKGNPLEENNGLTMRGQYNELINSELTFSSASLLNVKGQYNQIVNNYIHDGNYAGTWNGVVFASGAGHYIGYNTVTRSGRDVIKLDDPARMIVEYNDVSYGGLITKDSGLFYTAADDARNTEIRYNTFHDMYTHLGMGIYTDNQSSHFIIHHNVIWNVPNSDPIRLNSPSNYNLVYNNTAAVNTLGMGTYAIVFKGDMYGDRIFNNIVTGGEVQFAEASGYVTGSNLMLGIDPQFMNPDQFDFRLMANSSGIDAGVVVPGITDGYAGAAPDIGAYEYGKPLFKTGHDFAAPPVIGTVASMVPPTADRVTNGSFETRTLEPWVVTKGRAQHIYAAGAAWSSQTAITRTQNGSAQLSGSVSELEQTVTGLTPNTRYTVSLWTKASSSDSASVFGVRNFGGDTVTRMTYGTEWTQYKLEFITGTSNTSAVVYVAKEPLPGAGDSLIELDTQTLPTTSSAWLAYDVTSFIRDESNRDAAASLTVRGANSRTTFATKRTGTNQPRLEVMTEDSATPMIIYATKSAGVRTKTGTDDANTNYGNTTSFNAAYWNTGYQEEIYLQFPLGNLTDKQITSVKLLLRASGAAADGASTTVYGLAEDGWSESALTWNNKPQASLQSVYYDDIGLIVPLEELPAADLLRKTIVDARYIYVKAEREGLFPQTILDDFKQAIDAAQSIVMQASSTDEQLNTARSLLQSKQKALDARKRLLEVIQLERRMMDTTSEGSLPGQYPAYARSDLQQAGSRAYTHFGDEGVTYEQLLVEEATLLAATRLYEERVISTELPLVPKVNFQSMLDDTAGWSDTFNAAGGWNIFAKDMTRYTRSKFGDTLFAWNMSYDFANNGLEWPGMLIRSQTPNKPLNQDTNYLIIFKPTVWELQKWIDGKQQTFLTFPNNQFNGSDSRIYAGAVNVEGGVRILCYVNGLKVLDIVDRDNPITQSGYFGFVSSGQSGDIKAKAGEMMPEAALHGPTRLNLLDEHTFKLHAYDGSSTVGGSVYQSVYGGTLRLSFDPQLFDLMGAATLPDHAAASISGGDGLYTIDFTTVNPLIQNGEALLKITLRAKKVSVQTAITVQEARFYKTPDGQTGVKAFPLSKRVETVP